jgi:hypothetical protein
MQSAIGEMQKWNNALSLLGSTIEAVGGGTGVSDAAGVAGGMLSGAMSMSSLGPWGMAAGAAMGAITGIAELHDKKARPCDRKKQAESPRITACIQEYRGFHEVRSRKSSY